MAETGQNTEIVAEYWGVDRNQGRFHSWLQHPVMRSFLHRRISGDPQVSTVAWFKQSFFPEPAQLCLSLGCGFGDFERAAISLGIADAFHANDLSPNAIDAARERAEEAGVGDRIHYSTANLDEIDLPADAYDAIFGISSIHHVFQLERLFRLIRYSLKPGGLFLMDEYIGPSRFQSAPEVTDLINRILALLPEPYRRNLLETGPRIIEQYVPSSVDHFETLDPSEAVRSSEIMSTLRMYFDIVDYRPYGGAILHMLFSGIMGNFDENDEKDVLLLDVLATFEEVLEQSGVVGSDFAVIVARPKGDPITRTA